MFSNLKGDLFGGLSSAIIALPVALAFGIVAFAPLGPEFASQGAVACLYGFTRADFLQLLEETPKIASKIQLGIARELSGRLRSTSDEVRALEL